MPRTRHHRTPPTTTDPWMTTAEVAAELGFKEWTIRSWRRRRVGPPSYKLVGSVRYRRSEVLAWKAEQRAETVA
jgi:predicted DNA-binding transcriptional regulator AlpA